MPMDLLHRAASVEDPDDARAALGSAQRAANDRIWVHRNVARIYRERFDDRAAARAVLEELAPLTGAEWRLAAAAWFELGERERAAACLEKAAGNARTPSDLCTVALGYREADFADEGRLLVDGAETIATRAIDCWTVANVRRAFGIDAIGVLERGLHDATDVVEIITFSHALATYNVDPETLVDALARAERKASTVEGWLALALAYVQLLEEQSTAIRCVAAASKLSISSQHERAIGVTRARVSGIPLLDDERPRLTPNQLLRPGARAFGFDRDPAKLFGWLRARLPRSSIDALTNAGRFFVADDLRTLLEIQRNGTLPHPLPAYLDGLRDVRLGIGAGEDRLTRAFACTLLLLEDAASEQPGGHEPTMAMLLSTCIELGEGAVEGAIALFAALADAYDATYYTTTAAHLTLFAELALALGAAWLDPTDPRVDGVIDRLFRDEPRFRIRGARTSRWLLGLAERDGGAPGLLRIWPVLAAETLEHPRQHRLRERLVP
jgi:hypothetical protein